MYQVLSNVDQVKKIGNVEFCVCSKLLYVLIACALAFSLHRFCSQSMFQIFHTNILPVLPRMPKVQSYIINSCTTNITTEREWTELSARRCTTLLQKCFGHVFVFLFLPFLGIIVFIYLFLWGLEMITINMIISFEYPSLGF